MIITISQLIGNLITKDEQEINSLFMLLETISWCLILFTLNLVGII